MTSVAVSMLKSLLLSTVSRTYERCDYQQRWDSESKNSSQQRWKLSKELAGQRACHCDLQEIKESLGNQRSPEVGKYRLWRSHGKHTILSSPASNQVEDASK